MKDRIFADFQIQVSVTNDLWNHMDDATMEKISEILSNRIDDLVLQMDHDMVEKFGSDWKEHIDVQESGG